MVTYGKDFQHLEDDFLVGVGGGSGNFKEDTEALEAGEAKVLASTELGFLVSAQNTCNVYFDIMVLARRSKHAESDLLLEVVTKFHRKKVKLEDDDEDDYDDDFDDEEAEEKVPVRKLYKIPQQKDAQKSNENGKDLKPSTPRSKGQESFKKQEKTLKTPKGPSSVEDIKAKMQASIEKGG
ncbi:Nucleophosmin 1 [Sigmodon hispidus]